ncbi:MAG: protein-L-isoaspartate(D-aspartate) O-methyltransferase [Verrucomicrobia bacterium]|nr:protein-L-isoaspartate(D-aspartate) O-methyltransferase [Verrucomicrobiota bacterium]
MDTPEEWRARMVAEQLDARGITDARVLDAFRSVPRHLFCPAAELSVAHGDHPVDIGHGQTVSQPYMIAWMLQEARLGSGNRALEIGTGSGYQTALLSRLAHRIFSVECIPELLASARGRLEELGVANVEFLAGDGSVGWPGRAPFDVIIYSAAAPEVPDVVKRQLAIGGRLLAPVGSRMRQNLVRIERAGEKEFPEQNLGGCIFVPLRGAFGWSD